jgi:hypothetical protein
MRNVLRILLAAVFYPVALSLIKRVGADAFFGAIEDRLGIQKSVGDILDWIIPIVPSALMAVLIVSIYHQINAAQLRGEAWAKKLPAIASRTATPDEKLGARSAASVALSIIVFAGLVSWSVWPTASITPQSQPEQEHQAVPHRQGPPSLESLFNSDFNYILRQSDTIGLERKDRKTLRVLETIFVKLNIYEDFSSNGLFIAFYIPATDETAFYCHLIAENVNAMIQNALRKVQISAGQLDALSETKASDLKFTGRVYIYYETPMTLREQADIQDAFSRSGASVQFRSREYTMAHWLSQQLKQKNQK